MVRIMVFILFLMFPCQAFAASISAAPEVEIGIVKVGRECGMKPVKLPLFVKNKGEGYVAVRVKAVQPDNLFLRAGYEPLPLTSKVIIPDDKIILGSYEKRMINALVFFPKCSRFLAKKYQVHILFTASSLSGGPLAGLSEQNGIGANPGVESAIMLSTEGELARTEIVQEIGAAGGEAEDSTTIRMVIPPGALGKSIKLEIQELRGGEAPQRKGKGVSETPILAFRFGPEGTIFKKPVTVKFFYPDFDDDGIVDNLGINAGDLRIYYWNGFRWDPIGGKVDLADKSLSAEIQHFSVYGVFEGAKEAISSYTPLQKIITPAKKDGKNDFITFPGLQGSYTIDIFDVTGARVVRLENKNIWYGLDEDGILVESGPYIYRYRVDVNNEKKLITGVVVVAK